MISVVACFHFLTIELIGNDHWVGTPESIDDVVLYQVGRCDEHHLVDPTDMTGLFS